MAALGGKPRRRLLSSGPIFDARSITKPVSGVVFRGERPENTSLVLSNDVIFYPFWVLGSTNSGTQAVTGGYTNHSPVITVTDGTVFSVGDYAENRRGE